MKNILLYCLMAGVLSSCHFFKKKNEDSSKDEPTSKPIARVYNSYLYQEDINGLLVGEYNKEDSLDFVNRFVKSWIRKQVLLKKSEKNITNSLEEIEKKVEDYRYDLMVYEYQKKYINEQLDKAITESEILEFYNANKSNFELKQNIVKCQYARIPKDSPKLKIALKWFKSFKSSDENKFKDYAVQYSKSYSFEDNIWYDFNEIVNSTPFANYENQHKFLKTRKISSETDSLFIYLLKIKEFKISDEISPLEFVKDRIKDVIINKRKVDLIKKLEEGVYDQAKGNKDFEIYN